MGNRENIHGETVRVGDLQRCARHGIEIERHAAVAFRADINGDTAKRVFPNLPKSIGGEMKKGEPCRCLRKGSVGQSERGAVKGDDGCPLSFCEGDAFCFGLAGEHQCESILFMGEERIKDLSIRDAQGHGKILVLIGEKLRHRGRPFA